MSCQSGDLFSWHRLGRIMQDPRRGAGKHHHLVEEVFFQIERQSKDPHERPRQLHSLSEILPIHVPKARFFRPLVLSQQPVDIGRQLVLRGLPVIGNEFIANVERLA